MNLCVVSAFRNMTGRIDRYFDQVEALYRHGLRSDPTFTIRVVAVEGDSFDRTYKDLLWKKLLIASRIQLDIISHHHGRRVFSSTEDEDRLLALTQVMKTGMAAVDPRTDDVVLYVESDLLWDPHQVGSTIDMAYRREQGFDIVAPLVFAGENFYDVFCYRGLDGERFAPFKPYHKQLADNAIDPISEVSSVGSCLSFRSDLARKVVPIGEIGLLSWCAGARQLGYKIGVDVRFKVNHP